MTSRTEQEIRWYHHVMAVLVMLLCGIDLDHTINQGDDNAYSLASVRGEYSCEARYLARY